MQPGGQLDMQALLAQAMSAQQELAAATVTGQAGNGLVQITLSGQGEVTAISIDPKVVDPDDIETLQDLVVGAFADAGEKLGEVAAQKMGPLAGGLGGGGLGLPGM